MLHTAAAHFGLMSPIELSKGVEEQVLQEQFLPELRPRGKENCLWVSLELLTTAFLFT